MMVLNIKLSNFGSEITYLGLRVTYLCSRAQCAMVARGTNLYNNPETYTPTHCPILTPNHNIFVSSEIN